MLLNVRNLTCGYDSDIDILHNVSLQVDRSSIVGLIGPNGAGKSTLLRTIFGLLRPKEGSIFYREEDITGSPPHLTKRKGISFVTQMTSICPQLTVEENLLLGAWIFRSKKDELKARLQDTFSEYPVLKDMRGKKAVFLSGGQLKMLEIAKGLITHPDLLLFDEPAAGLAPKIANEVYEHISEKKEGLSILLVDHNIPKVIEIADYIYFLDMGKITFEGSKCVFEKDIRKIIRSSLGNIRFA